MISILHESNGKLHSFTTMSLLQRFKESASQLDLSAKDKLLLAVSGGVDSVVLCELCHQAGFNFTIVHCNFQLRGGESERDEQFVKDLGKKYGAVVLVKKFDTSPYAAEKKLSIQVAARELRYEWFNALIEVEQVASYVLTAHHAGDNIETISMNFFRGTGLHGLTGMPARAGKLRRPLLAFSREELLGFSAENQLLFVEDSSNQSSKYTRNLFRNEIIPLVEKVYPQVKENLQNNIRRFLEIEKLYALLTHDLKKKLCRVKGSEIHIPVKQLLSYQNRALIFAIIAEYGFLEKQVDEVLKLAESDSGKFISSPGGDFRIIKHRHWFIISQQHDPAGTTVVWEEGQNPLVFPGGQLGYKLMSGTSLTPATDPHVALLDTSDLGFPLILRRWKDGDYFYPLGMKKKKKLARFFIDQKLSKTDKEKIWVLETNKKIAWVVGLRIDDRFKITPTTKKAIVLSLTKT